MDRRTEIEDYITDLLFDYHNKAREAKLHQPQVQSRSTDALRQQWALSQEVRKLGRYVLENRHELQSTVGSRLMQDDVTAHGTIDARRTVLERSQTGHPTRLIYREPSRVYDTGTNRVLAYVLSRANELTQRIRKRLPDENESRYGEEAEKTLDILERVRRIGPLARLIQEARGQRRPTERQVGRALKSRKPVYSKAAEVYQYLLDVESGDPKSIRSLLKDTLVSPLDTWRAYELAVAIGLARSLSEAEGAEVHIQPIASSRTNGVLRCGRYRIHWQSQTNYFSSPNLTGWEEEENRILSCLGVPPGGACPDLVVEDLNKEKVTSVVEVKYYTGEAGWKDALREAVGQLMWYVRGYAEEPRFSELLGKSAIAVWELPETGEVLENRSQNDLPYVADFRDIRSGPLKWLNSF